MVSADPTSSHRVARETPIAPGLGRSNELGGAGQVDTPLCCPSVLDLETRVGVVPRVL